MDTDLILLVGAGCLAAIIIALSAKLSGRRKASKIASARREPGQREEGGLFEQFKRMAAEQPNNPDLWLKWGRELVGAGDAAKHPNMRLHRYNEACSCFQSATDLDPANTTAWRNWGQTLYALYKLQGCDDRLVLDNAHTKFQTASRLAPADAALWQHWGEELYMAATQCPLPDQRHELQDLADAKFSRAVELSPELILEWKKWRGGSMQRLEAQDGQGPDLAVAPETAGANPAGASPAEDERPAPAIPWARGTGQPVEASAWLTQDSTPAPGLGASGLEGSSTAPGQDQSGPPFLSASGKP